MSAQDAPAAFAAATVLSSRDTGLRRAGLNTSGGKPELCGGLRLPPMGTTRTRHRRDGRPRVRPVCHPGTAVFRSLTFSGSRSGAAAVFVALGVDPHPKRVLLL